MIYITSNFRFMSLHAIISRPFVQAWTCYTIARRADTEFLYDKPYQDSKHVRVSGPFTVESLSPHRVLATDDPATSFREDALNTQDFTHMILENWIA
jgi:hypothetical protein